MLHYNQLYCQALANHGFKMKLKWQLNPSENKRTGQQEQYKFSGAMDFYVSATEINLSAPHSRDWALMFNVYDYISVSWSAQMRK